jgi:hypothetical protein
MKQVYTTPQGTRIKTTSQTKANQLATDNPTVNVTSYKDNPDGTTTNTLSDGSTSTVKYSKTKDGSLQPKEINTVPMSTLANPPTPIEVPTPTVPTPPSTFVQNLDPAIKAGQDGIIRAQTEEAQKRDDILGRLLDSEVGSSQDVYDSAFQKAGGQDTLKQLTDASTKLATLQGKFRTGKQAVSGAEGQSKVFEGIQLGELSRQEAIEVGNQALVVQALQGNFDSARQIALDTSNFAIEDRKAELDNLYNQYNAIGTVVANQEAQLIDNERRRLDDLQGAVNGAISSGGASVEEMQQLTSATLPDDQKLAIAQKIVARTTQQDRSLERAVKNASLAATNASIAKSNYELQLLKNPQTDDRELLEAMQKLPATEKEKLPQLSATIDQISRLQEIIAGTDDVQTLTPATEVGREFIRISTDVADKLARQRTGAVVSKEEQANFKRILGLSFGSKILSNDEELVNSLENYKNVHSQQATLIDPSGQIRNYLNQNTPVSTGNTEEDYVNNVFGAFTSMSNPLYAEFNLTGDN